MDKRVDYPGEYHAHTPRGLELRLDQLMSLVKDELNWQDEKWGEQHHSIAEWF